MSRYFLFHGQGSRRVTETQEEAIRKLEMQRRLKHTVVPTADADVRSMLRQLGEPATLFGEREVSILLII